MNKQLVTSIEELIGCRKKFNNKEYGTMTLEQFQIRMSERFENLSENYPTIFEKAVNGFFDNQQELNRLYMAMGLIEKTQNANVDTSYIKKHNTLPTSQYLSVLDDNNDMLVSISDMRIIMK